MKRILALGLTVTICLVMLSGCGDEKNGSGNVGRTTAEITTIKPITETTAEEKTTIKETTTVTEVEVENPLSIEKIKIDKNLIGVPEVYVTVKNNGTQTIDAYDLIIKCYDTYGEEVKGFGTRDYFSATSTDVSVGPGKTFGSNAYWTLNGYDTTKYVEIAIVKLHTEDGTTIEIPEDQYEFVKSK